jgi:hypothetical protein
VREKKTLQVPEKDRGWSRMVADERMIVCIGIAIGIGIVSCCPLPAATRNKPHPSHLQDSLLVSCPSRSRLKRSFPADSEGITLPAGDIAHPWEFLD